MRSSSNVLRIRLHEVKIIRWTEKSAGYRRNGGFCSIHAAKVNIWGYKDIRIKKRLTCLLSCTVVLSFNYYLVNDSLKYTDDRQQKCYKMLQNNFAQILGNFENLVLKICTPKIILQPFFWHFFGWWLLLWHQADNRLSEELVTEGYSNGEGYCS